MSPRRIAHGGTAFERRLVRAARLESPRDGAEQRALAALGLSKAGGPAGRPGVASSAGAAGLLKALGAGLAVVVAGVAVGRAWAPRAPMPAARSVAGVAATPTAPSSPPGVTLPDDEPIATLPVASRTAPVSAPTRLRAAVGHAATKQPAPTVEQATPGQEGPSTLSAEIALVQRAARALAGGKADVALEVLDAYARECPHGVLALEASALRARALARLGDRAQARSLARELLAANPHTPLAPQLRALVDDDATPAPADSNSVDR